MILGTENIIRSGKNPKIAIFAAPESLKMPHKIQSSKKKTQQQQLDRASNSEQVRGGWIRFVILMPNLMPNELIDVPTRAK